MSDISFEISFQQQKSGRFEMKAFWMKYGSVWRLGFFIFFLFTPATWGAEMGEIQSGETRTGTLLATSSYQDSYQFFGETGDRVIITAARIGGGVEPQIYLYPPDGSGREASATGYDNNLILDHQLQRSGLYTIIIVDYNMDEEGEYAIALAKIPGAATSTQDPDGGPIASGETRTGMLTAFADADIFQFFGDPGDQVVIAAARTSGGVEPQIYLYTPDGSGREASATGYDNNLILDHQLQQSGLYTIIIVDYNMDEEGEYAIALAKIPGAATSTQDPDGGAIASGDTLTAALTIKADLDIFHFYGETSDRVVITATRLDGSVEPQIYLYPPDGSGREASATGYDNNLILDHQLQRSGLYTIIIVDYNMDEEGGFTTSLTKIPNTQRPGLYSSCPENGTRGERLCGSFSWNAVSNATAYSLYFGENFTTSLELIGDHFTSASLPFPDLRPNTVYYWHVVAHTPAGDIQGPYWWFETGSTPREPNKAMPWLKLLLLDE
jgi:hypothetical protein